MLRRAITRIRKASRQTLDCTRALRRRLVVESLEDRRLLTANVDWLDQFGASSGRAASDNGYAVTAVDGFIYEVSTMGSQAAGQTSAGSFDAFVRKLDGTGKEIWTRQFGTSSGDEAFAVAVDATGVYVAGQTQGAFPGFTNAGGRDAFVAKLNLSGDLLWVDQFGAASIDAVKGITALDGFVYATGHVYSFALPGETLVGSVDGFIRKYSQTGAVQWTDQFGTAAEEFPSGISSHGQRIYITGNTSGGFAGQPNLAGDDAFIVSYDTTGIQQFTTQFGTSGFDAGYAIVAKADGLYLAGYTTGAFSGFVNAGAGDAFSSKFGLNGAHVWTRQFGSSADDTTSSITLKGDDIYLSGSTAGVLPTQVSSGVRDAFVSRLSAAGSLVWSRQFGTTAEDVATGLTSDGAGLYVVGYTAGDFSGQTTPQDTDAFVRKYDESGNGAWTQQFGSFTPATSSGQPVPTNEEVRAVATASDGSVYAVGYTTGSLPFQKNVNSLFPSDDAFIRKYAADGSVLWTRQFGSQSSDQAFGVDVDETGVYVTGITQGAFLNQTNLGSEDIFVRKYTADGAELWTRQYGTTGADRAHAISVDASGVYLTGQTTGGLAGANQGSRDVFVTKLNRTSGSTVWSDQFGSTSLDRGNGIVVYGGQVYVTGSTSGTLPGQTSVGSSDAFLRWYNTDGTVNGLRQFGSSTSDSAGGIVADPSGVYVAGHTDGTFGGQTLVGGSDAFLQRFNFDGTTSWTRFYGSSGFELTNAIAIEPSGIYVAGQTNGVLPGNINAGSNDGFVLKFDNAGVVTRVAEFGTSGVERVNGVAVDNSAIYVGGSTTGAFPNQLSEGADDAIVTKFRFNQNPTDIAVTGGNVAENSAIATVAATFTSVDPDFGNTFTYSLAAGTGDTDNSSFSILGNALRTNTSFDFETKSTYSIRVRTTDQGGLSFEKSFTINVTDVNELTLSAASDASGNWTITDTDSTGKNNQLTLRRSGTNFLVTSTGEAFSNGSSTLVIPQAALTGNLTIDAGGGDDTLELVYDDSNPLPASLSFLGASGNDQLVVSPTAIDSVIYNATQSTGGTLILGSNGVVFSGVESIDLTGPNITDLSVAIDPQSQVAGGITTTISPHTTAGQTRLAFTEGLASLTVGNVIRNFTLFGETAAGDTINLQGAGTGLRASVLIRGEGGADVVNVNDNWGLLADKNFFVTAESFNLNSNVYLIASGTGMITIEADHVELNGTATVTAINPVNIRPLTNQRPIDLGTNTASSLSLTNAELARITSNIRIGSSTSGAINITNTLAASGRSLRLVTGSGVSGTGSVINSHSTTSGEVIFDQLGQSTYSGMLGGPSAGTNADKLLSIRKAGTGTLTIDSANTYTGWTSVDAGILRITNSDALGSSISGTIVRGGASLQLQNSVNVAGEFLSISGTGVGATGALWSVSGSNNWSGTIELDSAATIGNQTDTLLLNAIDNKGYTATFNIGDVSRLFGTLSGAGGITKTGSGQLLFQASNTYIGETNILSGSINLVGPATLGSAAAGTTIANGATLSILNTTPVQDNITVSGIGFTGFGAINGDDGSQLVGNVLLVGNTRIAKFDAVSPFVISGNISDGGLGYGLEVSGSEISRAITLAGTNTYSGPTQLIEPVTLNVNGSLTSNVSLVSGARVGGNGTINGSVTSTGTGAVNPGVGGSGRLTVVGDYSANTIFDIQDDYLTAGPSGDYDQLVVQGTTSQINLGTKTVTFQSAGGGTAPLPPNFLTLIKNETANAIVPFSNLTAGSQVALGVAAQARVFNSSYAGGNGRDLVLTGVTPNRAPSGSGGALNVLEDTVRVMTIGDFNFSDPDSGDSLQSVTLTSVPSLGQLYLDLNGNSSYDAATETLSAGSVVTVTQLAENRLRYLPPFNAFGFSFAYFSFRVSDGQLLSNSSGFTIHVASVNDAPFFIANGNQTIQEDAGPRVVNDWATSISAGPANESTQSLSFQVISNSNPQLFSVTPSVSPIGVLSYTSAPNAFGTATIGVRLQDSGGTANGGINTSPIQTFTITVSPVADDVSDILLSNNTVPENAVAGTTIGNFTIAGSAATFELVSGQLDNALFALSGNTLQSAAPFNYELRSTYSVRLRTTIGGEILTADYLILVTPVNEFAPTLTSPQAYTVGENSTLVGILTASDQDLPAPPIFYSFTGGADASRFTLVGNRLAFATPPNFEAPSDANGDNQYVVRVSASDGLRFSQTDLTVTVTNANDAPNNVSLSVAAFPESLPAGSLVGLLTATDEDADGPIFFAFSSNIASDNADFTILGNQLRTRREFDFETLADQQLTVSIVASDAQRSSSSPTTINLLVLNSPERPTANNQSLSMNSNGSLPITLSGHDGNGGTGVSYTIVQPPRFGQLTGIAPALIYSPNPGFTGTDDFYFTTSNGSLASYEARVDVTVVGTRPTVSFTTPTDSGSESAGAKRLTLQLSTPATSDLAIPINIGAGSTATANGDYVVPGFVTVAAGASTAALWLVINNNNVHEASETVELRIGDSAEYFFGDFATLTFTITDDDAPAVFQLTNRAQVVTESDMVVPIALPLSAPAHLNATIPYTVSGTAQAGVDFSANTNLILLDEGNTVATFAISILSDAVIDGTKTLVFDFGGPEELWPAGTTAADRRFTLTIRDDDVQTVNLVSSLATISEDSNSFRLSATVSPAPTTELRVPVAFAGEALGNGSTADYFSSQAEFVFQPGSTEASIDLSIVDDSQVEQPEQLRVDLQAGANYALGTRRSFVGTIQDNDQATVEFSFTRLDVWEGAGNQQIVARLNKAVPDEVVVTVQTSTSGTRYAQKDQDYATNFTTFVFAPNSLTSSRTINILDDNQNEEPESVQFTLLAPVNAAVSLGSQKSLALNIRDNDPLVSIVRASSSVVEDNDSLVQFEVRLSSPTNRDVVASLVYSGSATAGSDYSSVAPSTITIPGDAQSISRLINVDIIDDSIMESPETITTSLSAVNGGIASLLSSSATVEILDDDSTVINIDTPSGDVDELPLLRANGVRENRIQDVIFSVSTPVTRDLYIPVEFYGSAVRGLHYNVLSFVEIEEVYIPAGSTEGVLQLEIINNDEYEGNQDIVVQAVGVNLPATLPDSGLVRFFTIVDDDSPGSPFPLFDSPVPGEVYQGEYGPPIGSISPNSTSSDSCSPPVGDDFDFAICTTVAMAGSNGPLDGAIAFFDMNFNGLLDFVDANGNSQWDANEIAEPSTLTAKDGSFNLSLADYDFGGDGFLVPADGRFVMQGGVDISTGLGWPIPLTAPVGLFSLTPVSTLVESLVRTQQFSVPEAIERTTFALGLTGYDLASGSSIYQVLSNDGAAARAYSAHVQLYAAVLGLANYLASFSGRDVASLGNQAFASVAEIISSSNATLDLRRTAVIDTIGQHILESQGIELDVPGDLTRVASIIALGIQKLASVELTGVQSDAGQQFLLQINKIKKIIQGELPLDLRSLGNSAQLAALEIEYSSAGFDAKISNSVASVTVPPVAAINAAELRESNSGTSVMVFSVSLEGAHDYVVSLAYSTADMGAIAGIDYVATSGTLTWASGDNSVKTIAVTINGDSSIEPDEQLRILLSQADGLVIRVGEGRGTIINDDTVPVAVNTQATENQLYVVTSSSTLDLIVNGVPTQTGSYSQGTALFLTGQPNKRDALTIDFSANSYRADQISFNGGTGASIDSFRALAGVFDELAYKIGGATHGQLEFTPTDATQRSISELTDVEAIDFSVSSVKKLVIHIPASINAVIVEDIAGGRFRLRGSNGSIIPLDFNAPTEALRLVRASTATVITVNSTNAGLTSKIQYGFVDTTRPISSIAPLPQQSVSLSIPLVLSGNDPTGAEGSATGIKEYDLYVSTGSSFALHATVPASSPNYVFTGLANTSYWFRSIARDWAGNVELKNLSDAYTRIVDITPPTSSVLSAGLLPGGSGLIQVQLSGAKISGSPLTHFDVYVAIDNGAYALAGTASAVGSNSSGYTGTLIYQGIADNNSHTYKLYSRARDSQNNIEAAPTIEDVSVTATIATSGLTPTAIDVQKGANQRSYIRNLDILFSSSVGLNALANPDRIKLERFDIAALSVTGPGTAVAAPAFSVSGNKVSLDFGSVGLGGLRQAGNGFYRVKVDVDGNGLFADAADKVFEFYRLFGDSNGDGKVSVEDTNLVAAQMGRSGVNLDADVDGNGTVNSLDRTFTVQQRGRALAPYMIDLLDD